MSSDHGFVNLNTPARPCRQLVEAVLHARSARRQIASPGYIVVFESFEDDEVGDVCAQVHANHDLQRAIAIVRGDADVLGLSKRRNLLGL